MRTSVKRAFATLTAAAALVVITTMGASAATASAATTAPAGAPRWEHIGEFPKAQCLDLRDSYAGKAKCVKNAGGLYDLYVWV